MRLVKLAVIAIALLAVAGQAWTQRRRLKVIRALPGPRARDYYEATRDRGERAMLLLTALLAAGAIGAVITVFVLPSLRGHR